MYNFLNNYFKLKENNTTIKKEFLAGAITFLTMSYILIVNPDILSKTGMSKEALFTTTALATIVATLLMGFISRLPIAQGPGMGLNSFFAFTVVLTMGYSWQFALTAVFIEGVIFILLTFFNVREMIVKNIPMVLKEAIPAGIGIYITLLGLQGAGIVVSDPNTLLKLGDFSQHSVWIAFLGLIIAGVLFARKVNGALLIGILSATVFSLILGDTKLPEGSFIALPPSIEPLFGKALEPLFSAEGRKELFSVDMVIIVFTFLFVNLFDTVGTLIGVVSRLGILDENGNFPQLKKSLFADAIGTATGAILGTSTITSYIESASGVASGGRTGLTSVGTAIMFALALFLAPIFLMVPTAATSPALIIVGVFMMSSVAKIKFDDMTEALPAFLTIIFMPFAYSIAEGIVFGMLSYTFLKVFSGKQKQVTLVMYILSFVFLIKLIMDARHLI